MATVQQYIGYDDVVTYDNISADSEQATYPVTNLSNPATNVLWKSDSAAEQYVTIDLTTPRPCDYIGIVGHNFGTASCDVEVEAQTASGGAWSTVVAEFTPDTDRLIFRTFASASYYGIRLKLTPGGSVTPQAAVIYAGQIMLMQRGIYVGHTPIVYGRDVDVKSGFSESGAFLGRIVGATTYRTGVAIKNITPGWYRSTFEPFLLDCIDKPFFYAWRIDDYSDEVGFCWFRGGIPVPQNSGPRGLMSVSFDIAGVI